MAEVKIHKDITMVPLDKLEVSALNPNEMTDKKRELLKREIQRIGFVYPIIVRASKKTKGNYQILDGEQRYTVSLLEELKMTEMPCIVLDVSDAEADFMIYTLNNLKGELNPLKLSILVKNWHAKSTPDQVFHRTGMKAHQQEQAVERLSPQVKTVIDGVVRAQHRTFAVILSEEENTAVMRALRMTRKFSTEEALLAICEEYENCPGVEKVQEELSKVILKELNEGKALVDIVEHYSECDDARASLRDQITSRYNLTPEDEEKPAPKKKKAPKK